MAYATIGDLQEVTVPTVDVECGGLKYQLGALTRKQVKWIRDSVGYETDEEGQDIVDEDGNRVLADDETADLLMLACSMVQPALDPNDDAHLELLRGLPISYVADLVDAMMKLSGLREEDPTSATDG